MGYNGIERRSAERIDGKPNFLLVVDNLKEAGDSFERKLQDQFKDRATVTQVTTQNLREMLNRNVPMRVVCIDYIYTEDWKGLIGLLKEKNMKVIVATPFREDEQSLDVMIKAFNLGATDVTVKYHGASQLEQIFSPYL